MDTQYYGDFKSILKGTKDKHFLWATRFINFKNAYNNHSHPTLTPAKIKDIMMKREEICKLMKIVPDSQIREIINEIASGFSLPTVRWLGYVLIKLLSRTLSNLYINEPKLLEIRNNMGSNPHIILPSHRSYADFILMAFVCFHYNVQLPYVAAGIDFHSMRFMGSVLRECKAFFMRRSFADDHVYRTIFKEYFQLLIQFGESPLEFFIEGTRSRTSKTLTPKYGLLSMALETYLSGKVPDITLIPVSISYDKILEDRLFAYELLGMPKPKESTTGLVNAWRKLESNYGNIHFNFGEPISIREWIHSNIIQKDGLMDKTIITNWLAQVIVQRQTDLQILGVFNVLAIVISHNILNSYSYSLPLNLAVEKVKQICQLLKQRKGSIHIIGDLEEEIKFYCTIHAPLVEIVNDRIKFNKSLTNTNSTLTPMKDLFSAHSINEFIPLITLQLYINPSLHLFITPALIVLSFEPAKKFFNGSLRDAFEYISQLFKLEFVTLNNVDNKDMYGEAFNFLRELNCINNKELGENTDIINLLLHLIHPFTAGYSAMAKAVVQLSDQVIYLSENELVNHGQSIVKQELDKGLLHPFCLSKDLLRNALQSFILLKYLVKNKSSNTVHYKPEKHQLCNVIKFLDSTRNISDMYRVLKSVL